MFLVPKLYLGTRLSAKLCFPQAEATKLRGDLRSQVQLGNEEILTAMPPAIHLLVGVPLIVAACFVQLIPDSFYGQYGQQYYSKNTIRWASIVRREGIRFVFLLIGVTQLWEGIREW